MDPTLQYRDLKFRRWTWAEMGVECKTCFNEGKTNDLWSFLGQLGITEIVFVKKEMNFTLDRLKGIEEHNHLPVKKNVVTLTDEMLYC